VFLPEGIDMELQDNPKLYRIRHSMAHVLAQAVQQKFTDVKLGFGPPTEQGFFYDFDFGSHELTKEDLKDLEKRMKKIIGQKQTFERTDCDYQGATELLKSHRDEPYKLENIENLKARGESNFSFYKNGNFLDVCEGPHVEHTGELPADGFMLDRVAGAYWLGSEKNKMLTRIYALCFETRKELEDYLNRRKIAEQYDHKKLGKELEIFHFDDLVGKGLTLWLPNGTIIRDEIEKYAKEMEFKFGYKRVFTPHIAKGDLYMTSKHLPHYKESMFPSMVVEDEDDKVKEEYYLKPMNCPHHHLIYASRLRSYRDLPLRLAEYGTCYRYEKSGELSGIIRARCLTMNDAHLYCRPDQVEAEVRSTLQMYLEFFKTFKLKEYKFRLSLKGEENKEKFIGDEKIWDQASNILAKCMRELNIDFYEAPGEAAFYGPKIDLQFKNLMGREETASTIQVDYVSPVNFDLKYKDSDGQDKVPVIIHRAPLSTHERMISFLIEYYGGASPTWCAPVQVVLIPVNEECAQYCHDLADDLTASFVRVEVDESDNSFNKKIRQNTVRKIPVMLIVGANEVKDQTVTVRRYGITEQETIGKDEFKAMLLGEIESRIMHREPLGAML
jgi:threonyl-tRNA synthetase